MPCKENGKTSNIYFQLQFLDIPYLPFKLIVQFSCPVLITGTKINVVVVCVCMWCVCVCERERERDRDRERQRERERERQGLIPDQDISEHLWSDSRRFKFTRMQNVVTAIAMKECYSMFIFYIIHEL